MKTTTHTHSGPAANRQLSILGCGEALQSRENIIVEELISIECYLCNRNGNVHFSQSNHHSSPMSYMLLSTHFTSTDEKIGAQEIR